MMTRKPGPASGVAAASPAPGPWPRSTPERASLTRGPWIASPCPLVSVDSTPRAGISDRAARLRRRWVGVVDGRFRAAGRGPRRGERPQSEDVLAGMAALGPTSLNWAPVGSAAV